MKKTMGTPGFTAEAALISGDVRYQAYTEPAVYGGAVRPAGSLFFPNHPVYCLKFRCIPDPVTLQCHWVHTVGIVNPATGRCE